MLPALKWFKFDKVPICIEETQIVYKLTFNLKTMCQCMDVLSMTSSIRGYRRVPGVGNIHFISSYQSEQKEYNVNSQMYICINNNSIQYTWWLDHGWLCTLHNLESCTVRLFHNKFRKFCYVPEHNVICTFVGHIITIILQRVTKFIYGFIFFCKRWPS